MCVCVCLISAPAFKLLNVHFRQQRHVHTQVEVDLSLYSVCLDHIIHKNNRLAHKAKIAVCYNARAMPGINLYPVVHASFSLHVIKNMDWVEVL